MTTHLARRRRDRNSLLHTLANLLVDRHIDALSDLQRDTKCKIDGLSQRTGIGQAVYPQHQVLIGYDRDRAPTFKYFMLKGSEPSLSRFYVDAVESQRIVR